MERSVTRKYDVPLNWFFEFHCSLTSTTKYLNESFNLLDKIEHDVNYFETFSAYFFIGYFIHFYINGKQLNVTHRPLLTENDKTLTDL